jgi:hypothetical protein
MKKLTLIIINIVFIILLPITTTASGFETHYGGNSFSILEFGLDPYSVSTGGISSVLYCGANSSVVNPAGLGTVNNPTFETGFTRPFWDVEDCFLLNVSFGMPIKFGYGSLGTMGIAVHHFKTGSQTRTIPGEKTIDFTPTQNIITFAWGKGFGGNPIMEQEPTSFFGFSLNIYQQQIDLYSDSGFGLNFGFVKHFDNFLRVGFLAENIISPHIEMLEIGDSIPFNLNAGVGVFPVKYIGLLSELSSDLDGNLIARFGGELKINDIFRISSGYNTKKKKPSFGAGIKIKNITVDYAITLNSHLGYGNLLNLSLEF